VTVALVNTATNLRNQMYTFLVNLPADEHVLGLFQSDSSSYKDIFPAGEPFKSLYALYSLRVFLDGAQHHQDEDTLLSGDVLSVEVQSALKRAMKLIVDVLSDDEIVDRNVSKEIEVTLFLQLLEMYQELIKGACVLIELGI
jgi:ubiquitin carboxyl-terminal hydrolase 34